MYCPLCAARCQPHADRCPACGAPVQAGPTEPSAPPPSPPPEWTPPPPMAFRPGPPPGGYPYGDGPRAGRASTVALGRTESALHGDWRGALLCVAAAAGAVYLAGVLVTLFYAAFANDLPGQAIVTVPAAGVAAAFGATWQIVLGRDVEDVVGRGSELSYDVRAYPLLFSALGVWLLARFAARRFAAGRSATTLLDRLTQAARVGLLLGCCCLLLALLSRQPTGTGHVRAQYALAFVGAVIIGTLAVTVVALRHDPAQAPPALTRLGAAVAEPLVALRLMLPLIVLLGMLQLLASLAFGGARGDLSAAGVDTTTSRSLAAALLIPFAPNSAWVLFGIVVGAPLQIDTGAGFGVHHTTSLLDLADSSAWWWLAPIATVALFFAAGVVLALRSPTAYVARRRVGMWSLVFAVVSFGLSYAGSVVLHLHSPFGNLYATIGNPPLLMLVLPAAWAVLTGLGAVALVQRLTPATRIRWAQRVHAPAVGADGAAA